MTIQEFNAMGWTPGMTADYQGNTYQIGSCDFEEKLVGLAGVCEGAPDEITFVRCENVTVHKPNAQGHVRPCSEAKGA